LPVAAQADAPAFSYRHRHTQPFAVLARRGRRGEREALLQAFGLVDIPLCDCGLRIPDYGFVNGDTVADGGEGAFAERFELFGVPVAGESQELFF